MKRIVLFLFILICSGALLCAGGKKESSPDAQHSASGKNAVHTAADSAAQGSADYIIPEKVPTRTVAGTLAVLDMLDYLGVEVVAIPNTHYPVNPKYEALPRIGMPMTPDMERLKAVQPDFFITVDSLKASLEPQVKTTGIETVFIKTDVYENYLEAMKYLGKVYKKEAKAAEYETTIKKKVEAILAKHHGKAPKVLIVFGAPNSLFIATEYCFTGSLVSMLGGKNIWTDEKIRGPYAPINLELIKAENPDVILRLTHANPEASAKMFSKEFKNEFWSKLDAVKNGKVYDLDNKYFSVSGNIHIPEALDALDSMLYGN